MLRTCTTVEMIDETDILAVIARTINVSLIEHIVFDDDYLEFGYTTVWIDWDIPNYSPAIDEAIENLITARIRCEAAHKAIERESNPTIHRCRWNEWAEATTEAIKAVIELENLCLVD